MHFPSSEKPVTMNRWKIHTICVTRTDSQAWSPRPPFTAIRGRSKPLFSPCAAAEKNGLWPLRAMACQVLRSTAAFDSRSFLWRQARLPLSEGPACGLLALRQGQDRTPRLDFRSSRLHQAVCLPGGAALSRYSRESGGRGVGVGLADCQGIGQTLYARANSSRSACQSSSHRYRRNLHGQRAEVSHRRERSHPGTADLVRRQGSFGSQPRRVFYVAWPDE